MLIKILPSIELVVSLYMFLLLYHLIFQTLDHKTQHHFFYIKQMEHKIKYINLDLNITWTTRSLLNNLKGNQLLLPSNHLHYVT